MPPPGRRRSPTRGVFAIEDPALLLPDPIAIDTSFVVEALIATQPLHPTCASFLARIVETGVSMVTSHLLPVAQTMSACDRLRLSPGPSAGSETDAEMPTAVSS